MTFKRIGGSGCFLIILEDDYLWRIIEPCDCRNTVGKFFLVEQNYYKKWDFKIKNELFLYFRKKD